MENWEYAAGTLNSYAIGTVWTDQSTPGTFEAARLALDKLIREEGDADWVIDPCIIKRSDRHPAWARVNDHAAELLAEVLADVANDSGVHGAGIIQGSDLYKIFKKVAHLISNKLPQNVEEYGG